MLPPFYSQGLRFTCRQCHNCCRGTQPGWVYVSRKEILSIARFLGATVGTLRRSHTTKDSDGERTLRIRSNGDCVFWKDGCSIYPVRPRQCRTFPFWSENLASEEAWKEGTATCHGAGRGRLYRLEDIRAILRGRPTGAAVASSQRSKAGSTGRLSS
jgi:hypothetical protein